MIKKYRLGFTLLEVLVVVSILGILSAIVIIALNPARQFARARNTQRWSNINTLLNAVGQRMADNKGVWVTGGACTATLPAVATYIGSGAGLINLAPCVIPTYMASMVRDPRNGTLANTRYRIVRNANGRITISAPMQELGEIISVTR